MPDNRTKEEKVNDWFINFTIFLKVVFILVVVQPLKGLYWFVKRYTKLSIAMLLGGCAALMVDKIFAGQLDPRIFTPLLIVDVIAFSAMIVAMIPAGKRDPGVEFAPLN